MPQFRLLRRARGDLLEIAAYTADRWGEPQAERYLLGLYSAFQTIVERPELRKAFAEVPPYFRMLVGKHAVFYRVAPSGELLVVRVLHASMLPELHLRGDDQT